MPCISLTHERMLEVAVFCWDRNNMKRFMPSMSIQASVIQSPPLTCGFQSRGRALISLGTQTNRYAHISHAVAYCATDRWLPHANLGGTLQAKRYGEAQPKIESRGEPTISRAIRDGVRDMGISA